MFLIICIIGFTRLAIRGLDKQYNQPYLKGKYVTVFNGEVYNDKKLSQTYGLKFEDGQGDIEVVNEMFSNNFN